MTKMPGTSHLPALRGPESRGPERAACIGAPIGAPNHGRVIATSEEDGRKGELPGVFLTDPALPSLRWKTPEPVTSSRTPGRLGHGHSLPGPWTRRPRPFRLGRQLPGLDLRIQPPRRRIGKDGATGGLGGAPPGKSAPRPSPLQAAADTSASSPSVDPWGVEAPGELGGGEPLKLLAWTGRR